MILEGSPNERKTWSSGIVPLLNHRMDSFRFDLSCDVLMVVDIFEEITDLTPFSFSLKYIQKCA